MANNHGIKRPADYVPAEFRAELNRLSKADLMELVWDYAQVASDLSSGDAVTYLHIVSYHDALRYAGWQGSVKLRADRRELDGEILTPPTIGGV